MKGGGHVIMRRTKREGREVWRGGGGRGGGVTGIEHGGHAGGRCEV